LTIIHPFFVILRDSLYIKFGAIFADAAVIGGMDAKYSGKNWQISGPSG